MSGCRTMREINVERTMPVNRATAWSVLADFPNIADWNSGVASSYATGESEGGVGAQRHCDLNPAGSVEETIVEWVPHEKMVVRIDSASKLPIRSALATFTLRDDTGQTSTTGIQYRYDTKWGLVGRLMAPMMDGRLQKGFGAFLSDLESASTERSRSGR